MKIKSLLVGMLACTAMVSCTNEEALENNEVIKGGEKSYVSVNIVAPGSVTGRAASDFEAGSADEVIVNDAVFLFLNDKFKGCATPYYTNDLPEFGDADGVGQDKKATVLVIDAAKEVPTYLVAILNPVNKDAYTASTTLADLKAENEAYTTYTAKNFVMSNAVYRASNGKEAAATPITMDYIFDSAAKAEAKPLTIQVERVVGKVIVNGLEDAAEEWTMNDGDEYTNDQIDNDETKQLRLRITGWDILQNNKSTLVKNVDLAWDHTWWNDLDLKRSYWAKDYTKAGRNELLIDEMGEAAFRYVEETVSQTPNSVEADNVNPYLVVAGEFVDAEGKTVELVEWRGRKYTMDGYLNFIAGNSKVSQYWTKNENGTYTSFSVDLLELVADEDVDWLASAQLKNENTQFFTCTFNPDGTVANATPLEDNAPVVAAIEEFGKVQYWNGGNTYYYTPITHQVKGTDNFYGVVRNHVYNVIISSITGYGTPVSHPDNAIEIPEKPVDDHSYLAAEVVILDWKVVKNEVDLN